MRIVLTKLREQLARIAQDSKKSRFSLKESTPSSSPLWINCLRTSFVEFVTVHRRRHIQTPYWFGKLFLATVDGRQWIVGDDARFEKNWKMLKHFSNFFQFFSGFFLFFRNPFFFHARVFRPFRISSTAPRKKIPEKMLQVDFLSLIGSFILKCNCLWLRWAAGTLCNKKPMIIVF